jgi:hypothetical protein
VAFSLPAERPPSVFAGLASSAFSTAAGVGRTSGTSASENPDCADAGTARHRNTTSRRIGLRGKHVTPM